MFKTIRLEPKAIHKLIAIRRQNLRKLGLIGGNQDCFNCCNCCGPPPPPPPCSCEDNNAALVDPQGTFDISSSDCNCNTGTHNGSYAFLGLNSNIYGLTASWQGVSTCNVANPGPFYADVFADLTCYTKTDDLNYGKWVLNVAFYIYDSVTLNPCYMTSTTVFPCSTATISGGHINMTGTVTITSGSCNPNSCTFNFTIASP